MSPRAASTPGFFRAPASWWRLLVALLTFFSVHSHSPSGALTHHSTTASHTAHLALTHPFTHLFMASKPVNFRYPTSPYWRPKKLVYHHRFLCIMSLPFLVYDTHELGEVGRFVNQYLLTFCWCSWIFPADTQTHVCKKWGLGLGPSHQLLRLILAFCLISELLLL